MSIMRRNLSLVKSQTRQMSGGMTSKGDIQLRLDELLERVKEKTAVHLGYPYNLKQSYSDLRPFMDFFLNNLGDAYARSNYGINTQDIEREVIDRFTDIWGGNKQAEPIWGAVTSCGTEGNLLGILYGREACEQRSGGCPATLVSSVESHYSIAKAARMYCMPYARVDSTPSDGEICYKHLEETCRRIVGEEGGSVVCVANIGSTVRGAHDRIGRMLEALDKAQVPDEKRFLHCDAALSGLILPMIEEAKEWSFGFDLGADSIAVSGHKQLGTPVPCGVVCAKREHMERWAAGTPAEADYVNTQDSTISGSRSGFAALALWYAVETKGVAGMEQDARECIDLAAYLTTTLNDAAGSQVAQAKRFNPFSTTVVFARPSEELSLKYQLATTADIAHVVVTPSVTKETLNDFVEEYVKEFHTAAA
mmetsp:Transcript_110/g.193  ORF Transcript_110/g.193 Transcript_110/m.193 type:complete len:422 (-) Transcript_110:407-1672(-)